MGANISGTLSDGDGENPQFKPRLSDIPESCVALVLMHLDPPNICKLAPLNRAFRGASSADFIWESKLPSNYRFIIEKVLDETSILSLGKKDLYARLCKPNPFENGTKEIWLDKKTGGVCLSISSKALRITGIDDRRYWNHISTEESSGLLARPMASGSPPPINKGGCGGKSLMTFGVYSETRKSYPPTSSNAISTELIIRILPQMKYHNIWREPIGYEIVAPHLRFPTVAYVQQTWWFEVEGELEFQFPAGTYSLFFRLHLGRSSKRRGRRVCSSDHIHGWDIKPVKFQLTSDGQHAVSQCFLDNPGNWVKYHAGDFVVENPNALTKIKFSLTQIDCTHTKGGLCLDSVLICPSNMGKEVRSFL